MTWNYPPPLPPFALPLLNNDTSSTPLTATSSQQTADTQRRQLHSVHICVFLQAAQRQMPGLTISAEFNDYMHGYHHTEKANRSNFLLHYDAPVYVAAGA